jgi:nitrous oxidase accessory protein
MRLRFVTSLAAVTTVVSLALVGGEHTAAARTIDVAADGASLQAAISSAEPGDVLLLAPGIYDGPILVDRPLTLGGTAGVILDGRGRGRVLSVAAPDTIIRGLTIRNSGIDLAEPDAGIFLDKTATGAVVEDNRLENNLFGIYLHGAQDALVRNNVIVGRQDLRMNERGNGIHLWNAKGSVIEGNRVRYGRDGVFVTTSKRNVFRGNRFRDLRFAIHYMYTNNSEISGNVSIGNHVGYALMYSARLRVFGNSSTDDRDHGFLFNYTNKSRIEGNVVSAGGKKCVFLYNANRNALLANHFEGCGIGIHFTAGSEGNLIAGNGFIGNATQVKYVGTRDVEWSHEGAGNYWSDNPGLDLDGDGIGDTPYKPNDLVDQVIWRHPLAKLLLTSPSVRVLRWAHDQFPSIHPGGVIDSAPLMTPPRQAIPQETG